MKKMNFNITAETKPSRKEMGMTAKRACFVLITGLIALAIAAGPAFASPVVAENARSKAPGQIFDSGDNGEDAGNPPAQLTPAQKALNDIAENFTIREQQKYHLARHYFMVGKRHYDKFDYREAERNFKRAYELDPSLIKADEYARRAGRMLGIRDDEIKLTAQNLGNLRKISIQQKKAELERVFNAGYRLYEARDYARAIEQFELALEIIRWFPYRIDTNNYQLESKKLIKECKNRRERQEAERAEAKLQEALEKSEKEALREDLLEQKKIKRMLDQVREALRLNKFEKAEILCEEVLDYDRHNKIAEKLLEQAVTNKIAAFASKSLNDYYEHTKQNKERWDETWIPYDKDIVWASKDKWLQISQRPEGVVENIEEDPVEIQQIKKILNSRKVSLTFEEATLADVVSFLQDITNLNITIDPTIDDPDATINLNLKDILLKNALNIICDQLGKVYVFRGNVIFITDKGREHGKGIFEIYNVTDLLSKINDFEGPSLKIYNPEEGDAGGAGGISFDFDDEEDTGPWLNPDNLKDLIIQGTGGYDAWEEDETGFGTLTFHRGQMIVINTREVHREIRRILHNLRKNSGIFVIMEARFVTITDDYLRDIGVDVRGLGDNGYATPFTIDANPDRGGTDAGWVQEPDPNNVIAGRWQNIFDGYNNAFFSGMRLNDQTGGGFLRVTALDPIQIAAIIHAKDEHAKRRTLTAATVTATNQERVFVSVVNQRAYIADYELATALAGGIAAEIGDPIVRNFQDGIVLDVKPVVSSDRKYVTIDVRPTLATLVGDTISTVLVNLGTLMPAVLNSYIELPNIIVRQAFTTVTIPDGGTVMLGGLQERLWMEYTSTTPVVGSIPFLKLLFQRKGTVDEKAHLIVLLTAKIVILREVEQEKFGTGGPPD